MGIAKSIYGFGIFGEYSSNIETFTRNLSDKLNADFEIDAWDIEYYHITSENKTTNFGKKNRSIL